MDNRTATSIHWTSIVQFLLSLAAVLLLLGGAGVVGLFWLAGAVSGSASAGMLGLAGVLAILGVLCFPSAWLALLRLLNRPQPEWLAHVPDWRTASLIAAIVWPAALLFGSLAAGDPRLASWVLPAADILAVGVPIFWLVSIGMRDLSPGSGQRAWGALGFSLAVTPLLAAAAEILLVVLAGLGIAVYLTSRPDLADELNRLAQRLANAQADPEALQRILAPILQQPGAVFAVVALAAGGIPLIEELLKPLPLWLLARKGLRPEQGFSLGLICGGGFALVESLTAIVQSNGEMWAGLAAARAGTALLHVTTAGIIGWALARTWSDGYFMRAVLAYLAAVALHGLWNLVSLSIGLAPFLPVRSVSLPAGLQAGWLAPALLVILTVVLLVILIGLNRSLSLRAAEELPAAVPADDRNGSIE